MKTYHHFFSKLANQLKIDILCLLKERDFSVNEMCSNLDVGQSKLSHALASLKMCRIVYAKRSGKKVVYSLNKETILPILKTIDKHERVFCKECWARRKNDISR